MSGGRLLPTDLVDVRPRDVFYRGPTVGAANIPLSELAGRPFELPRPGATVRVSDFGSEAREAAEVLRRLKREPELVNAGVGDPSVDRYRLWSFSSHLVTAESEPVSRALCLACGSGREAVALAAEGWKVTAVDLLEDAIERGRELESAYLPPGCPPIRWIVADLRQPLHSEQGEFELVTQFFFADTETPARIQRHLAPGGLAVLEAFSGAHWRSRGRSSSARVLHPADWPDGLMVAASEGMHEGRHTTRVTVRKS